MSVLLHLQDMSNEEKIEAMELLWNELCENAEEIPSPVWHGDVLSARVNALKNKDEEILDWDTAKAQIRDARL